jgi:hypothetical protein
MKQSLYILILTLLVSCGDYEYVRFETAQPDGVNESESFNRKVKGEYINCSNPDDIITITNNLILNSRTFKFKSHRADLDFDSTININRSIDEELTNLFTSEGYKIEISGDTINASQTNIDTIFWISENQVLKKFKGSYFLNFKRDENFWDVSRLNLSKDTLLIGQISPSDTLLRFDFVAKTENFDASDSTTTTEYCINPSKRQFKKLMKPNSFDECECYYKKK